MATKRKTAAKSPSSVPMTAKPVAVNLLKKAAASSKTKPKSVPKGTVFQLPEEVGNDGQMLERYSVMHKAVSDVIEASGEEKTAKNKSNMSKGMLKEFVEQKFAVTMAEKPGSLPETPIQVINNKGESLTYVVQDRTKSCGLNEHQQAALLAEVGDEFYERMTYDATMYSFNTDVMREIAGDIPANADMAAVAEMPKVEDVVGSILSEAIMNTTLLTDEQKSRLIVAETSRLVRREELDNISIQCRKDPDAIERVLEAINGTAIIRYLKS